MSQSKTTTVNGKQSTHASPLDAEVVVRAQRRQFRAADKLRILQAADACTAPGQLGALLRREGIYSSYLADWHRAQGAPGAVGQLQGLGVQKRGRPRDEQAAELTSLRQENEQLKAQVAQAAPRGHPIIAAQKKLAQILEQTLLPSKGTPS